MNYLRQLLLASLLRKSDLTPLTLEPAAQKGAQRQTRLD